MSGPLIYLVAAESSGDSLGAELAAALKRQRPDIRLAGVGGAKMAGEEIESPFDIADLSVLGYVEGIMAYRRVVRRAEEAAAEAVAKGADIAVLIDSWGFTLRVAQRIRAKNPDMKLIKYVGPQVWATRPGRAKTLAATVDQLLTIHPFDAPLFEREGLPTRFVGNPALWRGSDEGDGPQFRKRYGVGDDERLLLVLFGSRRAEIERLFEPFADALKRLKRERPNLCIAAPLADSVAPLLREKIAAEPGLEEVIPVPESERYDAFAASDAALACSGTITSELALASVPAVVGYKLAPVTWALAKILMRAPYISLVNIAANEELMPELVQFQCTGVALAEAAAPLFDDPDKRTARKQALRAVALKMKGEGDPPAERAARAVLDAL